MQVEVNPIVVFAALPAGLAVARVGALFIDDAYSRLMGKKREDLVTTEACTRIRQECMHHNRQISDELSDKMTVMTKVMFRIAQHQKVPLEDLEDLIG